MRTRRSNFVSIIRELEEAEALPRSGRRGDVAEFFAGLSNAVQSQLVLLGINYKLSIIVDR